ncbi:MAG: RNA polymerase sigma factor [Chloroflexota bacterium]
MKTVSEEYRLLEAARQFESQALAQIYDTYSPGLYRYAMRRLGDAQLAEDCVAETFTRFLQALRKRRGPRDHLQAYLYRAAHNWIVDQFRREKPDVELADDLPSQTEDTERDAAGRIQQARVRAAIRRLTPDQQQVITLKYLEGWENEEIARALGKPPGAVKSLQHRALAALQRQLMDEVEDEHTG